MSAESSPGRSTARVRRSEDWAKGIRSDLEPSRCLFSVRGGVDHVLDTEAGAHPPVQPARPSPAPGGHRSTGLLVITTRGNG